MLLNYKIIHTMCNVICKDLLCCNFTALPAWAPWLVWQVDLWGIWLLPTHLRCAPECPGPGEKSIPRRHLPFPVWCPWAPWAPQLYHPLECSLHARDVCMQCLQYGGLVIELSLIVVLVSVVRGPPPFGWCWYSESHHKCPLRIVWLSEPCTAPNKLLPKSSSSRAERSMQTLGRWVVVNVLIVLQVVILKILRIRDRHLPCWGCVCSKVGASGWWQAGLSDEVLRNHPRLSTDLSQAKIEPHAPGGESLFWKEAFPSPR